MQKIALTQLESLSGKTKALQGELRKLRDLPQTQAIGVPEELLTAFRDAVKAGVTEILSKLDDIREPVLEWQPRGDGDSLVYWDRTATFLGRQDAVQALQEFLNSEAPLAWTVIAGPAGVGKSRLAVEAFAHLQALGTVRVGLVKGVNPWLSSGDYTKWRAPRDTVLIVDYAAQAADAVRHMLADFNGRQDEQRLRGKVRLLLIETIPYDQTEFGARARIVDGSTTGEIAGRLEWRPRPVCLDVDLLTVPNAVAIVSQFAGHDCVEAERQRVEEALGRDQELRRPLFAAMLGLAIKDDLSLLSVQTVSEFFLRRARLKWGELGVTAPERKLCCAATIAGGCDESLADQPELKLTEAELPRLRQAVATVTGATPPSQFAKLEPDFLGGLFVLTELGAMRPAQQLNHIENWLQAAWRCGNPSIFLTNLAFNFSASRAPDYTSLVAGIAACCPDATEHRAAWHAALPSVVFALTQAGADAAADQVLSAQQVRVVELDDWAALAMSLFAGGLSGEFSRHPKSGGRLESLRALATSYPEDAAVREWLAKGLFNAFNNAGSGEAGTSLLAELRALATSYPEDAAVREQLAAGLFNAFKNAGSGEAGTSLLAELRALATSHPENAAVRERLAKGLFNASLAAGSGEAGTSLLAELRALATSHPEDAAVRERLAVGYALFGEAIWPGDEAIGLFEEARRLVAESGEELPMLRKVIEKLIATAAKYPDSESLVDRLHAIQRRLPPSAKPSGL